jgi:acyl carrier protein
MTADDPLVLGVVLELLAELKEDWDYMGEIGPDTRFVAELGLESLEIVVLAALVQERYGRLPFPAYFDEIGQLPLHERDVSVGALVHFICAHRQPIGQEV